ncbi:NB-ARC domain-containing protein [Corchorus olitorius]|uniref:NB-ARC domain-containing protein n=1 Tax=Corchorus olitorius TaxID=93759 RepID=A0A1R3GB38_9ROSI|nr:NB-ARC domain-containing protein [Corchorus olitorius]
MENEDKAKKSCFAGFCIKTPYQLCKKAVKEANSIAELLEKEDRFDRVSCRPAPEGMRMAMRPVKDYEEFESRRAAFDGVMNALKDDNLAIIGVYGMGGVGKTTLVKQVASQAKKEKVFETVVMAALTQNPNIPNVQNEIAEKLIRPQT